MPIFFGCPDENAHCCQMKNRSPPPPLYPMLSPKTQQKSMDTYCDETSFPGFSPAVLVGENPGNEVDCAGPKVVRLRES